MVENEDEYGEENGQEETGISQLRKAHKELPKERAAREAAEDRASKAERELAIMKSGIDTNSPTGKLFVKAYDGEGTPEAIQAAATEYGLYEPVAEDPAIRAEAQALANVASTNQAAASQMSSTITQADVRDWDVEKMQRFRKTHPHEWELLKRGQDLVGVTF